MNLLESLTWARQTFEITHTKNKTISSMEGIRGLAVFLVFLVHYVSLVEPWLLVDSMTSKLATHVHSIGNIGVDLFFVLSGYLIYGMLIEKQRTFGPYILRRIQRIYPAFIAVFLLYLLLSVIFPTESKIPPNWGGASIYILQNIFLLPGLFNITPIITVAWSLSYEFFYYLVVPLVVTGLSLKSWQPHHRLIFFLGLSLALFTCFALMGGQVRLMMFLPGILLYEVLKLNNHGRFFPIGIPALLLAIGLAAIMEQMNVAEWLRFSMMFILFFIFCFDSFAQAGITSRILSFSPLRWLGNMSYSYYLFHGITLRATFMCLDKVYPATGSGTYVFWLLLPVTFVITLVASSFLFIYVEKRYSLT